MPREHWEYIEETTRYRIAYYGTGMTPMFMYFDDKDEAIAKFKEMCDDPYKGASELIETRSLMRKVYK